MANIKLKDLTCIDKSDSFDDLEDCIQELSDDELNLQGGFIHDLDPFVPTPDYLPKIPQPR